MSHFATDRDAALELDAALGVLRRREQWGDHLGPFPDDDDAVARVRAALRHLTRADVPSRSAHAFDGAGI